MSGMKILIDDKDVENRAYYLPWHSDGTCYNFRCPDRQIYPDEIDKIKRPSYVETLVIACDLNDYNFIKGMKNLTQLYIYDGTTLEDISFVENLTKLRQLCIIKSHISSLNSIRKLIESKDVIYKKSSAGASPKEKLCMRLQYGFEGICIQTDAYDSDGTELLNDNICRDDIRVNDHLISYSERMRRRREKCMKRKGKGIEV